MVCNITPEQARACLDPWPLDRRNQTADVTTYILCLISPNMILCIISKHLVPALKHGGEAVMIWACFVATRYLAVTESMNTVYQSILESDS